VTGPPEPPRRTLLDTGFGDDDGTASPEVEAALAAYDRDQAAHRATLAALQHVRVLVPVVAMLGESEVGPDGLERDKTADMATVLMTNRNGRTALLAFTSMAAMQRWRADSRPVPVGMASAAQAAVYDGADALLLDVAGPVMFVVEGEDLRALADGFRLTELGGQLQWAKLA
jgi:hypothetical protein